MDTLFTNNAITNNFCGNMPVANINTTGGNNNPFAGTNGCTNDNYLTRIQGTLSIPTSQTYRLAIDGDDAVDVFIDGTLATSWYGGHGSDRSTTGLDGRSITLNLTAGNHTILFRQQEAAGDDSWGLLSRTDVPAATRDDFYVRVQSCPASNAALREASCKRYPNGQYKPTGILHDYGETGKMFFGLIGGSQSNNLEGGVLRRNVSNSATRSTRTRAYSRRRSTALRIR
jgi:type IV pilus assembly protein PilY1